MAKLACYRGFQPKSDTLIITKNSELQVIKIYDETEDKSWNITHDLILTVFHSANTYIYIKCFKNTPNKAEIIQSDVLLPDDVDFLFYEIYQGVIVKGKAFFQSGDVNELGGYATEADITDLENTVNSFDSRITDAENDASNALTTANSFDGRVSTNETDISNLDGRVSTNETDISTVSGRVSTNETDISNLDGRVSTNETDISTVSGRVETNETDIDDIDGRVETNETDISNLDGRVSTNETDIDDIETQLMDIPRNPDLEMKADKVGGAVNGNLAGLNNNGNLMDSGFSPPDFESAFTKNTAFNKNFGTSSGQVAEGSHNHNELYEPIFTKNSAFNKDFGKLSGEVAQGNHDHDELYEPVITKNTAFNKNFGTSSGQVAEGNHDHVIDNLQDGTNYQKYPKSISANPVTDLNNLVNNGTFYFNNSPSNAPLSQPAIVINISLGTSKEQIFKTWNNPYRIFRRKYSGTWDGWEELQVNKKLSAIVEQDGTGNWSISSDLNNILISVSGSGTDTLEVSFNYSNLPSSFYKRFTAQTGSYINQLDTGLVQPKKVVTYIHQTGVSPEIVRFIDTSANNIDFNNGTDNKVYIEVIPI